MKLFDECDLNHDKDLDENETADLCARLFYLIPRLGLDFEGASPISTLIVNALSHVYLKTNVSGSTCIQFKASQILIIIIITSWVDPSTGLKSETKKRNL